MCSQVNSQDTLYRTLLYTRVLVNRKCRFLSVIRTIRATILPPLQRMSDIPPSTRQAQIRTDRTEAAMSMVRL
jgi:hypothetical protein